MWSRCRACPRLVEWREQVADGEAGVVSRRRLLGSADPRASAIRMRRSSCSAWRRRRTERTAPAGCSPATAAATGCSGRCTRPGSPTSRSRSSIDDGLRLTNAWVTAAVKCAPPDNKPLPSERDTCAPFLEREFAALTNARVVVCLGIVRLRGGGSPLRCPTPPEVRPRRRSRRDDRRERRRRPPDDAAVLVPPEPAEHVHQAPDRAHVRLDLLPRRATRSTSPRSRELVALTPYAQSSRERVSGGRGSGLRRRWRGRRGRRTGSRASRRSRGSGREVHVRGHDAGLGQPFGVADTFVAQRIEAGGDHERRRRQPRACRRSPGSVTPAGRRSLPSSPDTYWSMNHCMPAAVRK